MKLIFINRFFHPDLSATSQMLSDLAFALARRGHKVSIIASRQRYDEPGERLPAHEIIDGVEVHRVWTSRFGRSNVPGRAVDYATFYLSAAWRLWRLTRTGDIVVAKTDPPMLSVPVVPIARLRGARAVNWLQDVFPEVAQVLGFAGRLGRMGLPLLRRLRDRSLRSADASVVLGELMARRVAGLGVPRERIAIIPNWADGRLVSPVARADNPLRRAWGLDGRFVVGYSGNLGRAHDIETMLQAIRLAQDGGGAPVTWLFVGGGKQFESLRAAVQSAGLPDVLFKPYQPREMLAQSLSAADVHLISLQPALEGLIVPSKFYGIAAAGRPAIFIGHHDGEIARTIADAGCGLTVAEGDGAALAYALQMLAADRERCARMGSSARRLFEGEFDKDIAVERWSALIRMLAAVSSPVRRPVPGGDLVLPATKPGQQSIR